MFPRLLRNGTAAIPQRFTGATEIQVRNGGSLKIVAQRMKSVASIQKITKAMKMVAAAKMRGDMRRLELGMPFCEPVQKLFQKLPEQEKSGPLTMLAITSDKGLCGGVNSFVNKQCRLTILEEEAKGNSVAYMCIGGKGVAGMKRLFADRFKSTFEEIAKAPWCFLSASIIAERLVAANPKRLSLVSNHFQSMVAYDTRVAHVCTKEEAKAVDRSEWSKAIDVYEFEPPSTEVWDDLHEFYYGAVVYGAQLQSAVTEQSQRMSAMENASKNAGEMLEKLTLVYNRARQAKITTELCEIISGASAL